MKKLIKNICKAVKIDVVLCVCVCVCIRIVKVFLFLSNTGGGEHKKSSLDAG